MTAKRNNEGKPRLSLIPRAIQVEMAKVLGFGEGKYSLHNWRGGGKKLTALKLMDSAQRHIVDYIAGDDLDEESGLHSLGHAACNIAFLLELLADGVLIDDRYKVEKKKVTTCNYKGERPDFDILGEDTYFLHGKQVTKEEFGKPIENKRKDDGYRVEKEELKESELTREEALDRVLYTLRDENIKYDFDKHFHLVGCKNKKKEGFLRRLFNKCFVRSAL